MLIQLLECFVVINVYIIILLACCFQRRKRKRKRIFYIKVPCLFVCLFVYQQVRAKKS